MKKKLRIVSRQTEPHRCANCFSVFDGITGFNEDDRPPQPGAYTMCINCGAINIFCQDMSLRVATQAEIDKLGPERKRQFDHIKAGLVGKIHPKPPAPVKLQLDDWMGQNRFR